jgi:hypothetical protein
LDAVLTAIAIIPSAPVLVPELAGGAAVEVAELRQAVGAAVSALPGRWITVGVGARDAEIDSSATGSFGGYGVDVPVGLSSATGEVAELPLCALIAGWVRGQLRPAARTEVRVFAADQSAETACAQGRALRAEIDKAVDQIGVLVVADGAHTLTPPAPGGYDPDSVDVQTDLDDALANGDTAALLRLPSSIPGRVAWQVLAGLAQPRPRSAKELHRGAPFGVGYFAGVWMP